jgi:inorganic pyrophosphatase
MHDAPRAAPEKTRRDSNTMVALVAMSEQDGPDVVVVVEVPTGSRNKYEFDRETGHIVLDRMLFTAVRYPADYGYIEGAQGEDGDYLDALVLVGEPTFPGCRIRARPVGLFRMWDEKGQDEKIICVPLRDPMWSHIKELDDIQATVRSEIEHFFTIYKDLEEEKVGTEGFGSREEALRVIEEARARLSEADGG